MQKKQRYLDKLQKRQEKEIRRRIKLQKKMDKKNNQNDEVDESLSFDSTDFENMQTIIKPSNEFTDFEQNEIFDKRDITEYDRDIANNNLLNRLNNDIDIRTSRNKNKQVKSSTDIVKPYADNSGDNYASFDSILKSSKKDFSNAKLGGRK